MLNKIKSVLYFTTPKSSRLIGTSSKGDFLFQHAPMLLAAIAPPAGGLGVKRSIRHE